MSTQLNIATLSATLELLYNLSAYSKNEKLIMKMLQVKSPAERTTASQSQNYFCNKINRNKTFDPFIADNENYAANNHKICSLENIELYEFFHIFLVSFVGMNFQINRNKNVKNSNKLQNLFILAIKIKFGVSGREFIRSGIRNKFPN